MILSDELRNEIKGIFREIITEELPDLLGIPSPKRDGEILNAKQAASLIDRSVQALYCLVHYNKIPSKKKANRLYFLRSELEQWVRDGGDNR